MILIGHKDTPHRACDQLVTVCHTTVPWWGVEPTVCWLQVRLTFGVSPCHTGFPYCWTCRVC